MDKLNPEDLVDPIVLHDSDEGLVDIIRRAHEYYTADNIQEAIAVLNGSKEVMKTAYAQILAGNCYRRLFNIDKALECWKKALEINPYEYSAYINIANMFYAQGDLNTAIDNWMKAFVIQPENSTVNMNLAVAYNTKGCRIKSTKFFERYLKYTKEGIARDYLSIKETMIRLRNKVDFYFTKMPEVKATGDLRAVVSLYLRMISTYADLPVVYLNLAEIFLFDKNYDKALEFYLIAFKNYEVKGHVVWAIANLYEMKKNKVLAYCYYKRCERFIPKTSTKYSVLANKLQNLMFSAKTKENCEAHINIAQDYEKNNMYEDALVEYQNAIFLSNDELPAIEHRIEVLQSYINPEMLVVADLYKRVEEAMDNKRYNSCITMCDRIILLSDDNSKEGSYALKCKTECKRLLMTRNKFDLI